MIAGMTLSPWMVWVWGIADSVRDGASFFAFAGGMLALIGAIIVPVLQADKDTSEVIIVSIRRLRFLMTAMFVIALPVSILMPSSKTVAIMVIAPAIVNSSVIQKDVPELYEAAKKAMLDNLTGKN